MLVLAPAGQDDFPCDINHLWCRSARNGVRPTAQHPVCEDVTGYTSGHTGVTGNGGVGSGVRSGFCDPQARNPLDRAFPGAIGARRPEGRVSRVEDRVPSAEGRVQSLALRARSSALSSRSSTFRIRNSDLRVRSSTFRDRNSAFRVRRSAVPALSFVVRARSSGFEACALSVRARRSGVRVRRLARRASSVERGVSSSVAFGWRTRRRGWSGEHGG